MTGFRKLPTLTRKLSWAANFKSCNVPLEWLSLKQNFPSPDHTNILLDLVFLPGRGEISENEKAQQIGTRKKRWSARKDYPELVRIASELVAPGGQLWTATNHRGIAPTQFARLVERGLPDGVFLERVCPLAEDFPCIGEPHMKMLVWRWPT